MESENNFLPSTCGTIGWIGLAGCVIAWDVLAPETLSHAVDRALEHPSMKYVSWAVGGIVSGHLFNLIPERFDPIQQTANFIGKRLGL